MSDIEALSNTFLETTHERINGFYNNHGTFLQDWYM